ncbi:envoplakin-like [Pagrus major]|uniref:envoplakin-like n=1 Tax=Pagrus major TaxID=143350 RepID=UPI003CC8CF1B
MSRVYGSVKINKFQSSDLAELISRMQRNYDRAEKTLLQSEELLTVDKERDRQGMTRIHQKANANNLTEAERLLRELIVDLEKSKKTLNPQAPEIEKDMKTLQSRLVRDCATFRELYNQTLGLELTQSVNVRTVVEVVHPQRAVTVQSAPGDPRAADLASELDKIYRALEQCEEQILGRLRAPLGDRSPTQDLANRLHELEKSAQTVRKLESEKAAVQREMGPILAKKPLEPTASSLPPKLSAINNKIDDINTLIDLYTKKATASVNLEKQIRYTDGIMSGFEDQLAKDGVILDEHKALENRNKQLQLMHNNVVSKTDELNKLGRDLDLTEQACRHLQYSFNEYCPDIRRQEDEVKKLNNRYTVVKKLLKERSALIKEATSKNENFQIALQSLDFFLVNLPNNAIRLTDDVEQIRAKQNSQMRVMEDIRSKSKELDRVRGLSRDLQRVLYEYEDRSKSYRGTWNDDYDYDDNEDRNDVLILWRPQTMAQAIQRKEINLLNFYSEVSAENNQLLIQLETARNIKARNEEKVSQVIITRQIQSQRRDLEASVSLKNELSEETSRRLRAEHELETYRKRLVVLKNRRGVERVEEKEVVQYYRDPKLEMELQSLTKLIQDETFKRSRFHSEIKVYKEKVTKVQLTKIEPKLMSKIMTQYERDLQLDREAARIRDEMQSIRLELQTRDTKVYHMKTELTVLAQQKTKIRERVIKKEVVRFEKDPEMLQAVLMFKSDIATVESHCKTLSESIFSTRSQIHTLESVISTIQPREVTRVVTQVQQDPETLEESRKLRIALEEERREIAILMKDMRTLQLRYSEVEKLSIKVEVKEIINEFYRVTPEMEAELVRLRKELHEWSRKLIILEKEMNTVTTTVTTQRTQKPKVEYREVIQEVIKLQNSPEVTRELQTITNEVSRLQLHYNSTLELLTTLCQERDMLKVEKSKVETKIVVTEFIRYENDPLLEKEADRLRRTVREESQLLRSVEESVIELRNQYIFLEQQKQEERIVVQEVVRIQKDHKQILEHERLSRIMNEEIAARRQLEIDVRQLRTLIREKETSLSQMDDRQIRIQLDSELRQIKSCIYEFENTPIEEKVVIKEVFKVERDAQLEKVIVGLRAYLETEATNTSRVEREIRNLTVKLEVLQKEKSVEKVIYREVVRVEKDPAVEAELEHLRQVVTQERNLRCGQEDKLQNINIKITHLQTSKTVTSQEETTVITTRDALQREKEDLLRQLKILESERQKITITFQQESRLVSERDEIALQRSLKTSSEMQRLEKEILNEKDKMHQKDSLIIELQKSIKQEEHSETHTRERTLSTKVTIMDPETGKDMSPYDAYVHGLITREHYIRLSKLECNWEEITSTGPDGDTVILQDRKTGKQYSVKDALRDGRLTQLDLMHYKEGNMHISEFALLVVGETKPTSISTLSSMQSSLRSSYTSLNTHFSSSSNNLNGDEYFPISGIFDTTTESRMSVRSALTRKIIDNDTALTLLEAQAASGGIVDLNKKDKLSVHKAAEQGLIDHGHMYKLVNAQKAFTGVEDPVTKERLAVGRAAEKGYMPRENARRYMEVQCLTGGLVNPAKAGRITVQEALTNNLIDSTTADHLLDETSHTKELVDPITKEKISYKQAMDRCKRDISTGLLLLPAASTDASNAPSFSNFRLTNPYGKY